MPSAIEPLDRSASARPEAERQLAAAAERHREVVASMQELGRSVAGQHVAVKAVGRAVHLVTFALTHAAETGVPVERLVELTDWDPRLVNEVARAGTRTQLGRPIAAAGLDADAVAQAAAGIAATARLQALTQRILADIADDAWSPAPADLADLHERLDSEWRAWCRNAGTTAVHGTEQRRAPGSPRVPERYALSRSARATASPAVRTPSLASRCASRSRTA